MLWQYLIVCLAVGLAFAWLLKQYLPPAVIDRLPVPGRRRAACLQPETGSGAVLPPGKAQAFCNRCSRCHQR